MESRTCLQFVSTTVRNEAVRESINYEAKKSEKLKRVRRIAGLIQSVVAQALQREVNDPRLANVSISGIDLAPDYGQAVLFFTMSDPTDTAIKSAEKAFSKAAGFLRFNVSKSTELRYTPQLYFRYDASIARAEKVQQLIDAV